MWTVQSIFEMYSMESKSAYCPYIIYTFLQVVYSSDEEGGVPGVKLLGKTRQYISCLGVSSEAEQ